jgi:two-component system chemotaxis response regulator CheY
MKKILLIEDDPELAQNYRARLQAQNYHVDFAPDGQAGYYAIYDCKPDVVLIDLAVRQMDALSLIGKIRAQKQFQRLQMFALADSSSARSAEQAIAAGANQLFDKSDQTTLNTIIGSLQSLFELKVKITVDSRKIPPAKFTPPPIEELSPSDPEHPDNLSRLHETFIEEYGSLIHPLRKTFLCFSTAKTPGAKLVLVRELLKSIKNLHISAVQCDLNGLAMLIAPLESLVRFLEADIDRSNPGIIQCIANAIDLLAFLHNETSELKGFNNLRPNALVVDDESISRKAISLGLQKGRVNVINVDNAEAAIQKAEENVFDIIFLDVEMSGTNGLMLCSRIRGLVNHKNTPILFVTALDDLKTRASSKISGANHFLIKPVNTYELAVTAWTFLFRNRLKQSPLRAPAARVETETADV